jgi:hypothetical protein
VQHCALRSRCELYRHQRQDDVRRAKDDWASSLPYPRMLKPAKLIRLCRCLIQCATVMVRNHPVRRSRMPVSLKRVVSASIVVAALGLTGTGLATGVAQASTHTTSPSKRTGQTSQATPRTREIRAQATPRTRETHQPQATPRTRETHP